jgi:hypothetical protein
VIDASISLAWSLDDETDSRADEALAIVEQSGALVPTLWTYEIANSLTYSSVGRASVRCVLRRSSQR